MAPVHCGSAWAGQEFSGYATALEIDIRNIKRSLEVGHREPTAPQQRPSIMTHA
jgi:hypothetical protein